MLGAILNVDRTNGKRFPDLAAWVLPTCDRLTFEFSFFLCVFAPLRDGHAGSNPVYLTNPQAAV
jgi:hypothetical protein